MHPFLCIGFKLWVSSAYEVNWTAHLYEIQLTHPRIGAISHFKSALKKKKFGGNNKKVERLLWNCQRWNQGKATRMGRYHEGIFTCFFEGSYLKCFPLPFCRSTTSLSFSLSSFPPHTSLNSTENWTLECYPVGSTPPKSTCSLIRREVWLNPDHRCPRTPNTHTTTSSLMAKQQYKNLKTYSRNRNVRDFSRIPPFCKCSVFIRHRCSFIDVSPVEASHIPANITNKGSPSE